MEEFKALKLTETEIVLDKIVDLSKLYSLIQAEEDFILIYKGEATIHIAAKFFNKIKSGELLLSAREKED